MPQSPLDKAIANSDLQADLDAIDRIDPIPTILNVVCRATGLGFAAIARVSDDRWIACKVLDNIDFGLQAGSELSLETTICNEVRNDREPVVIDHVDEDPRYKGHPTAALYKFQSYISMPIIRGDGRFFGTLCAIDPRPAKLNSPETIGMFKLFADLIASHLDNYDRLQSSQTDLERSRSKLQLSENALGESEAALLEERQVSELREQFIAVLGHDLRNPLASLSSGVKLLKTDMPPERRKLLLELLEGSVVRMGVLIDNVLDFARGRLGSGIPLAFRPDVRLEPILQQVVSELRLGAPDRVIETNFNLSDPIRCDPSRIGQLVSNLIGNALTHGSPERPVRVHAENRDGVLTIWVANSGAPIPAAAREQLFRPFFRGAVRPSQQGLGLGLHIASEIAKAHGGALEVASNAQETRFTLRMPTSGL